MWIKLPSADHTRHMTDCHLLCAVGTSEHDSQFVTTKANHSIHPQSIYQPLSLFLSLSFLSFCQILLHSDSSLPSITSLYETHSITSSRSVNYHSCLSNITLLLTSTHLNLSTMSLASLPSLYHLSPFVRSLIGNSPPVLISSHDPTISLRTHPGIVYSSYFVIKPFCGSCRVLHFHSPFLLTLLLFCLSFILILELTTVRCGHH